MKMRHVWFASLVATGLCLPGQSLAERPRRPEPQDQDAPPTPAPREATPAPPRELPPPPSRHTEAPVASEASGQWVYTQQYEWVWMPYGDRFVHVPTDGAEPCMFVYRPVVGWIWVAAPWVWGLGPAPWWGPVGVVHFGWWGHGYGHWRGWAPVRRPAVRGWAPGRRGLR